MSKIIFFGSDDFASTNLEALLNAGHDIAACVTGPDKPQGRGMKMTASPIKEIALQHHIPVLQPSTLKDKNTIDGLRSYQADIFVVVAYGRLLTQEVLDIPRLLCMNVHGSLLPHYRGAAPVNWAILNGDKETGVTIQKMALALDAGEIIAQEKMIIDNNENAAQLRQRMSHVGAKLLVKVLEKDQFSLSPQDEKQVTYAPKLNREMGKIDWQKKAVIIASQIRGLQPWPGAYTSYQGKMLKVIRAEICEETASTSAAGHILKVTRQGFEVGCGDQSLLIKEVQPEAGKIMTAESFAAGYKIASGMMLGS